jgi:hypothetical protein
MSTAQLLELAWDLEFHGFAGHRQEVALRPVIRAARVLGVSRTLVDVLADPAEPEVARMRAFGHVAAALAAADAEPDTGGHDLDDGRDAAA